MTAYKARWAQCVLCAFYHERKTKNNNSVHVKWLGAGNHEYEKHFCHILIFRLKWSNLPEFVSTSFEQFFFLQWMMNLRISRSERGSARVGNAQLNWNLFRFWHLLQSNVHRLKYKDALTRHTLARLARVYCFYLWRNKKPWFTYFTSTWFDRRATIVDQCTFYVIISIITVRYNYYRREKSKCEALEYNALKCVAIVQVPVDQHALLMPCLVCMQINPSISFPQHMVSFRIYTYFTLQSTRSNVQSTNRFSSAFLFSRLFQIYVCDIRVHRKWPENFSVRANSAIAGQ